jgi:integrase
MTPRHAPRKRKLTALDVTRLRPAAKPFLVWDSKQHGLALRVQPSGAKAWKCIYSFHGRPRWLHIGNAAAIGLQDARQLAAEVMLAVAKGKDPAAEKRADRSKGTWGELAVRYRDEYAKGHNKSWKQADALVRRYLKKWDALQVQAITRADVRAALARITAPVLANQVLASASAIFSWAIKQDVLLVNPCAGIDRNRTQSRERVLAAGEVAKFWSAFDDAGLVAASALKCILLTGQRPGEISSMRRAHIVDGWWEMPGAPEPGWPGTKNGASHRVWLAEPVQQIIAELADEPGSFVFAGPRGNAISKLDAAMRALCAALGCARATPHDLRRTFSSCVTALGFGRDAMNRVTNHREGGISSVYDRHQYADENKRIMESVAAHIMGLATGREDAGSNVVPITRPVTQ